MAKKVVKSKPAKKPASKKAAKKAAAPKSKTRFSAKRKKAVDLKPKDQRLPGLEDLPNDAILDELCESIADSREQKSDATKSEKAAVSAALNRMRAKDTPIYRARGIELIFVRGEDKLKVKAIEDQGGDAAEFMGTGASVAANETKDDPPVVVDESDVPF